MKVIFIAMVLIAVQVFSSNSLFAQETYLEKGNALLRKGELTNAELLFKEAIRSDSTELAYPCQLGYTLIEQKRYMEADSIFNHILQIDSSYLGAIWYSGLANFYAMQHRKTIDRFEKAIPLLNKYNKQYSGQYYSANWFLGKSYAGMLKNEGLSYAETDRMFACYEEYLRLQPNANDAASIKEFITLKKERRPPSNIIKWVDK